MPAPRDRHRYRRIAGHVRSEARSQRTLLVAASLAWGPCTHQRQQGRQQFPAVFLSPGLEVDSHEMFRNATKCDNLGTPQGRYCNPLTVSHNSKKPKLLALQAATFLASLP
jgi:hypothetical protein